MILIFLTYLIEEDLQTSELVTFVAKDHEENKGDEDEHIPSGICTPKALKKKKHKREQDQEEQEGNSFSI